MTRAIKRKWLKAKLTLDESIHRILEINRRKKHLSFFPNNNQQEKDLNEELRLLNRIAEQQAHLLKHYELKLAKND